MRPLRDYLQERPTLHAAHFDIGLGFGEQSAGVRREPPRHPEQVACVEAVDGGLMAIWFAMKEAYRPGTCQADQLGRRLGADDQLSWREMMRGHRSPQRVNVEGRHALKNVDVTDVPRTGAERVRGHRQVR